MKRKFIFVIGVLFLLFLVGCNKPEPDPEPVDPHVLTGDFLKVRDYLYEQIPSITDKDIELITEYPELNAYIEWDTSDFDVVDTEGKVTPKLGKVIEVTLSCYITIDNETKIGEIKTVITSLTFDDFCKRFENQFARTISRNYNLPSTIYDVIGVTWTSSNTEIFDNEGTYNPTLVDEEIEIRYSFYYNKYTSEERSMKKTVDKASNYYKFDTVTKWIKSNKLTDLYITDDLVLPSRFEKYDIDIEWSCSNPSVLDKYGKIKHYVYERYITLFATYKLKNGSSKTTKFECIVSPLDTKNMKKTEIIDNFLESIALPEYSQVKFGYAEAPNLSTTYGHLYFYLNQNAKITDMMIPIGTSNRDQTPMVPKLVVIHDTANYRADARANAAYCQSGYSGGTTSWHYTVGNDGIFQTLPDNECGGHANGSFSQKFNMIDTGVKATVRRPQTFANHRGVVYINNIRTNIKLPDTFYEYTDYGMITEIGENGNYYIAESWFCDSNGKNAVKGGNGNGIGIETAVNKGTDYLLTMRLLAKHVAELLLKYDLTLDRVVQHNTTSGKNCPQAIREANFWYTLKDYISLEMFAKTKLKDCQFVWKSTTPIMSNSGAIALDLKNYRSVSYNVLVSEGGKKLVEHSYTTILTDAK